MRRPALHKAARPWLRPAARLYARIMQKRRTLYASGVLPAYAPSVPAVSVGNIVLGGSGKTPLVSVLLTWAVKRGKRAVVLIRGYGGRPGAAPLAVRADTPPAVCGDEGLMLARAHPGATVLAHPRRALAAELAERFLRPDLLILDDGMQHLALRRSVNIVLLRPQDLDEDYDLVLPAGPWREGAKALEAADVFAVKLDAGPLSGRALERLAALGRPVYPFRLRAVALRPLFPQRGKTPHGPSPAQGGEDSGVNGACRDGDCVNDPGEGRASGRPYLLASGVGNPSGVENTASAFMGQRPARHFIFADHHRFTARDLRGMLADAPSGLPLLCTAKDAVKLEAFASLLAGREVFVLETAPVFEPPLFTDISFCSWWEETFARLEAGSSHD
ncbi:MAG: tetraacyldisaccharide 4'-kinase [Desulfovibrio sp.]|nr:tetraacyldisaccharide 4'-kinase [Desulfovibrio sp.]